MSARRAYISNKCWSNRTGGVTKIDLLSLIFMGANTLAMLHIDSRQRVQLLALGSNVDVA